jgi:hypothetical protein
MQQFADIKVIGVEEAATTPSTDYVEAGLKGVELDRQY